MRGEGSCIVRGEGRLGSGSRDRLGTHSSDVLGAYLLIGYYVDRICRIPFGALASSGDAPIDRSHPPPR